MIHVLTINWTNKEGSTVEIIRCIEDGLKGKCKFTHCFQVGEEQDNSDYRVASWNVTRAYYLLARIVGIKYGLGSIPTGRLINHIKNQKPDVVHIHCPNFYNINLYKLFSFLKREKIPTVITNHAEFYYTGNCPHALDCVQFNTGCRKCERQFDTVHPYLINRTHYEWKKMKKSFESACRFVMTVVSGWQMDRIKSAPITQHLPAVLIENGVDVGVFKRLDEHGIDKKGYSYTVTHVTSNFSLKKDDMKGGYYLVELARKMPDTLFWILGNYDEKDKGLLPDNVEIIGHVKKEQLVKYYNAADVTVLTSRKETFGMACAESLCCGTPIVAFKAGGTESIAIDKWCRFAEFGDVDGLRENVLQIRDVKALYSKQIEDDAKDKYSEEIMVRKYYDLYKEMAEDTI